jgi:hypothetical protein
MDPSPGQPTAPAKRRASRGLVACVLVAMVAGGCASPPRPLTSDEAAALVTATDLAAHLDAIAAIAEDHAGTRGTGSPGNVATADYVERVLADLGYAPTILPLTTFVFDDPGGSEVVIADGPTFADGSRVLAQMFSPAGVAEGPIVDLGWDPASRTADGAGCDAADFAGLPPGAIVLTQPAPCFRRAVLENAQAAGAGALVTAAPWAGPGEIRRSTLVTPAGLSIPAVVVSRDVADALADGAARGRRARVTATGASREASLWSVLAERTGADPSRVVMLGAHLDSSLDGPGLNDDGSGVAAILAIARAFSDATPATTLRFAFWAAEETGLHGSTNYVDTLSQIERTRIVGYLNADMLGSPNGFAGVYDEPAAPQGSALIRDSLAAALDAAGVAWEPVDTGLGADHAPFAAAGIPTGGVFAGASELLTTAQAERSGSRAGVPADACYHLACDDRANVNEVLLLELARALAWATAADPGASDQD